MILIKNSQRKIELNRQELEKKIQKILDHLGYANFDIGIWFTTNATIKKYNKQYRNKDKATDTLSFPYHYNLVAGKRIKAVSVDDKNLGDIIISPDYVQKDAKTANIPFEEQLDRVIIHSICHLLGYDHETDSDYKEMQKREDELYKKLV